MNAALARVAMVELEMTKLQEELASLKKSLTAAVEFIRGNGDPTKGLLWITADLTRLLATNTQMIETNRQLLTGHILAADARWATHMDQAHRDRRSVFWEGMRDDGAKLVMRSVIVVVLALIGLGIATFVRNGGHL